MYYCGARLTETESARELAFPANVGIGAASYNFAIAENRLMPESLDVFIHPSSVVDNGARVGAGTKIWHYCHVAAGAVIGERCVLGQNVFVGSRARLGNNVKVQNNVSIYDEVIIDDDVFCGPSMVFTNVNTPRSHVSRKHAYDATHVRRGATIGANATIVCGCTLGEYSFVGAGSVVTREVKPFALVVGNPARPIGWMCKCGARLEKRGDKLGCRECSSTYVDNGGALAPA